MPGARKAEETKISSTTTTATTTTTTTTTITAATTTTAVVASTEASATIVSTITTVFPHCDGDCPGFPAFAVTEAAAEASGEIITQPATTITVAASGIISTEVSSP